MTCNNGYRGLQFTLADLVENPRRITNLIWRFDVRRPRKAISDSCGAGAQSFSRRFGGSTLCPLSCRTCDLCSSFTNLQSTLDPGRHVAAGPFACSVLECSMSAVSERRRRLIRVWAWTIIFAATLGVPAARAETLTVAVDQAQVVHLPKGVATIVPGNPLIADVSPASGGVWVVTGKGYGTTNMLALDRQGSVVMNMTVEVLGASGSNLVVVYKGAERETYSCAPDCEHRITLGDSKDYFKAALDQSHDRTNLKN